MENQKGRVLIVDDEVAITRLIARLLSAEGYACETAINGEQALQMLQENTFQLLISDIVMPGMSGIDLLMIVKKLFPDLAVIMVTGVDDRDTAIWALEIGAYGYVIKPFSKNEMIIHVVNSLERRRLTLMSREYERTLEREVEEKTRQIRHREEHIALRLVSASGFRDDETGAHIRRIGLYSSLIARKLGWPEQSLKDMRLAACMHDVGKIGIPDSILQKPGELTPEEREIMKRHAQIGAQILGGSDIPLLDLAAEIALSHHEKWDGSGYPHGLAGEAIPESGRIVAVADVYDALVYDRVYRPAIPEDEALSMMLETRGAHFEPRVFDCFMSLLQEIRGVRAEVAEDDARREED
jgi:putative two-component system response regulator